MEETPTTEAPTQIEHNIRVIHVVTGEHVICNFGQIREEVEGEQKFVAYQLLYPLTLSLSADSCVFKFSVKLFIVLIILSNPIMIPCIHCT